MVKTLKNRLDDIFLDEDNIFECNHKNCPNYGNCNDTCDLNILKDELLSNAPDNYTYNLYEKLITSVKDGKNIFITSSAGCGKSYLLKKLNEYIMSLKITATTGFAALNVNGQTLHSFFKVGTFDKSIDECVERILNNVHYLEHYLNLKIVAIDEISMLSSWQLDYLNEVLKRVRNNNSPFGGIQMIFIGDFYQLPPVNTNNNNYNYAFISQTWNNANFTNIVLKHNYRQNEDKKFNEILDNIRAGIITQDDYINLYNRQIPINLDEAAIPMLLPRNAQVKKHNHIKLMQLEGELINIPATFTTQLNKNNEKQRALFEQFKTTVINSANIEENLQLKINAKVMITKNLQNGLVNGSTGYVTDITEKYIEVTVKDVPYKIERITETMKDDNDKILVSMRQFPIKLAFAVSIHKSQGATLESAFMDCNGIFEVGQFYVGISRVKSLDGLYLKNFDINKILYHPLVKQFYETLI